MIFRLLNNIFAFSGWPKLLEKNPYENPYIFRKNPYIYEKNNPYNPFIKSLQSVQSIHLKINPNNPYKKKFNCNFSFLLSFIFFCVRMWGLTLVQKKLTFLRSSPHGPPVHPRGGGACLWDLWAKVQIRRGK